MTESLIRENETHLYGPRGARKRHSKLARGPICCYFINRAASVEKGREVVTHLLTKNSLLCLYCASEQELIPVQGSSMGRCNRRSIRQDCAQEEFVNPCHEIIWSMSVCLQGEMGLFIQLRPKTLQQISLFNGIFFCPSLIFNCIISMLICFSV